LGGGGAGGSVQKNTFAAKVKAGLDSFVISARSSWICIPSKRLRPFFFKKRRRRGKKSLKGLQLKGVEEEGHAGNAPSEGKLIVLGETTPPLKHANII